MAESFVKTMSTILRHMPLPDRQTALRNLAIAFEHYNSVDRTWRLAFKPWLPSVQVAS